MDTENQRQELKVGFMVELTIPSRMLADVERELATCISFGRPVITKLYEVPPPRPVQTVLATL